MRAADAVHLGLMLAALAITYVVPFELLLLAYVVLGPAHCCTEISWLHDRQYFLPPYRSIPLGLVIVALLAPLTGSATGFGLVFWAAFVARALLTATTVAEGAVLVLVALGLTAAMVAGGSSFAVLGILLPTLIHGSLFTLVFVSLGALRSSSRSQALLVIVYLLAIAALLASPPSAATRIPAFAEAAEDYFGNVAPALGRLLGIAHLEFDMRLTGLLAFVYTYHYLNWFMKADVIRWADISRPRLVLVIAASATSTALYFYYYAFGFGVLLALSLAHVVLEFPLNNLAIRQLGAAIGQALVHRSPVRAKS